MNSSKALNKIAKYKMDMIEEIPYIGCWKILYFDFDGGQNREKINIREDNIKFELKPSDFSIELSDGTENFHKTESEDFGFGDIIWYIYPNNSFNKMIRPLFECNTFEYDSRLDTIEMSSSNLNFEFDVDFESAESSENYSRNSILILSNKQGDFKLICQRVLVLENFDKKYNYSNMFNNQFMSDVKIKLISGQCIYAHKIILTLTLKDKTDQIIEDLNELIHEPSLIELILFYLYNNCLPKNFEKNSLMTAEERKFFPLIKLSQKYAELDKFRLMLETFISNNSFKENFYLTINDVKKCSDSVNSKIKHNELTNDKSNLFSDPAKFVQISKFCFKKITLAFIKIIRLLDYYAEKQHDLSKEDKAELITRIQNCFPFFVEQFRQLLGYFHKHCQESTEQNRLEVAEYLVPELDSFVDKILKLISCWEDSLDKIILDKKAKTSKSDKNISDEDGDDHDVVSGQRKNLKKKLERSIKNAMHIRELKKIQKLSLKIKKNMEKLESYLKKYQQTQQNLKTKLIFKELNNITNMIVNDFPTMTVKLDNVMKKIKENSKNSSKQKKFRYTFKITSSRIQWILNELRKNNQISNSLINQLVSIVNYREFSIEIDKLGFGKSIKMDRNIETLIEHHYKMINPLATEAMKLYKSKHLSDILLQVIDEQKNTEYFNVHGVLVASRCAWFQRALSSGMKESINRKVVLYDSNLKLFEMFIEYLYNGNFDSDNELDNYQLIELLTLADKYECDSLKLLIEQRLINEIETFPKISDNNDWILDLIDIMLLSEQFNLKNLMSTSINLIVEMMKEYHVNLEREEFKQLNDNLFKKIEEKFKLECPRRTNLQIKSKKKKPLDDIFNESSDDDIVFDNNFENPQSFYSEPLIDQRQRLINYAHPLIVADPNLLEDTFFQLKEIVGNDLVTHFNDQELVKLLVRYDYDLNRVIPIVLNCE